MVGNRREAELSGTIIGDVWLQEEIQLDDQIKAESEDNVVQAPNIANGLTGGGMMQVELSAAVGEASLGYRDKTRLWPVIGFVSWLFLLLFFLWLLMLFLLWLKFLFL